MEKFFSDCNECIHKEVCKFKGHPQEIHERLIKEMDDSDSMLQMTVKCAFYASAKSYVGKWDLKYPTTVHKIICNDN